MRNSSIRLFSVKDPGRYTLLWVCLTGFIYCGWPGLGLTEEDESHVLTVDTNGVQRATLILESYSFSPSHLIVQAGVPVALTLQNESFLVPHNFVLDDSTTGTHVEQEVSSGEVAVVRFLLRNPGIYPFYCDKQLFFFPSHQEEGMEGRIEVR